MSASLIRRSSLPKAYLLFFVVSSLALFLGFYRNQWNAARDKKFSTLDKSSEGLIIGRLVQSRQEGLLSKAALIGMGDVDPLNMREVDSDHQYDTYLNGGEFRTYFTYRSQNGFQAFLFSLFDSLSPNTPQLNLRLFRGLTSLLTAVTIGLFLTWLYREFGLFTALLAFGTTLLSQWLTVFGRNLFWGIWIYFLPFLAVTFALTQEKQNKSSNNFLFASAVFITLFLKCLYSGYDFISTAAISACVPIIYYAVRDRCDLPRLLRKLVVSAVSTAAAILLSLSILAAQVGSLDGGFREGIRHIVNTIGRRTYGDPGQFPLYAESLQANTMDVIFHYLSEEQVFRVLPSHFVEVILLFMFFSVGFVLFARWKPGTGEQSRKGVALIAATWLAFVSSISTYIIFKSASYIHTHLYSIVWHLPFTILGFAMCGYVLQIIFRALFAALRSDKTLSDARR